MGSYGLNLQSLDGHGGKMPLPYHVVSSTKLCRVLALCRVRTSRNLCPDSSGQPVRRIKAVVLHAVDICLDIYWWKYRLDFVASLS